MFFLKKQFSIFFLLFFVLTVFLPAKVFAECCVGSKGGPCLDYGDSTMVARCLEDGGNWSFAVCKDITSCPQYALHDPSKKDVVVKPSSVTTQPYSKKTTEKRSPETNPICWFEDSCKRAIEKADWKWDKNLNFEIGGPGKICGKNLGVCIPAGGKANTEISIGGSLSFNNLGEYFKTIFVWLVGVGGLIAAVLIIVGGFMYMTSAGSSERVKAAKTRISGALMGLFLLLGSYTLLYTINPDLVRLKLPQVYMVRGVNLSNLFCMNNPTGVLAFGGTAKFDVGNNKIKVGVPFSSIKESDYSINLSNFAGARNTGGGQASIVVSPPAEKKSPKCGWGYYLRDTGGDSCLGDLCPIEGEGSFVKPEDNYPQVCATEDGELYSCVKGVVSGIVRGDEKLWKFPWIYEKGSFGPINLYLACNDGEDYKASFKKEIKEKSIEKIVTFRFEASVADLDKFEANCSSHGGVKGYVLVILANGLGLFRPDFLFVLGKDTSASCNLDFWHTSQTTVQWLDDDLIKKMDLNGLIKPEDLRNGLMCDINTKNLAN